MIDVATIPNVTTEKAFATIMLSDALDGCQRGSTHDCAWLQRLGPTYLELVSDSEHAARLLRQLTPATTQLELEING